MTPTIAGYKMNVTAPSDTADFSVDMINLNDSLILDVVHIN